MPGPLRTARLPREGELTGKTTILPLPNVFVAAHPRSVSDAASLVRRYPMQYRRWDLTTVLKTCLLLVRKSTFVVHLLEIQ